MVILIGEFGFSEVQTRMPPPRRVRKIAVERSLKKCPSCGYTDGFHVMFTRTSHGSKKFHLLLLCPMCSDVFDMGLRLDAPEGG